MTWVDVHTETLMKNSSDTFGNKTLGFAHYLKKLIDQNQEIIELLKGSVMTLDDKTKQEVQDYAHKNIEPRPLIKSIFQNDLSAIVSMLDKDNVDFIVALTKYIYTFMVP